MKVTSPAMRSPINQSIKIMYSYIFKSEFFVVLTTSKDNQITRDTFNTRTAAELFRNEVVMKRDDVKEIEILELLSQTY